MNLVDLGLRTAVTGTLASLTSAAAAAQLARSEGAGALQPTNSTSHWLNGDGAGRIREADLAHTGVGAATHFGSGMFWAAIFEAWRGARPPRSVGTDLRDAALMALVAAVVDYGVVPRRVTPGWETVLPPRSIGLVYGALAIGLAAGALMSRDPD
ncbi:hypothetical protein [Prosthecomicrobium sp. N25]|uniref:hypothetical protein n=1 Tax=Prosthecomicrobium sp. N25 TaxID=3129254 RepID=UPI0030775741